MGTMIQRYKLTEADFRGERFRTIRRTCAGNSDVLILTRPDVISAIHREYLAAGADIIETNTFSSTAIAQADYALEAAGLRAELRGRAAGARGGRRVEREDAGPPALRRRLDRADEPDAVDLAQRQRPVVPRHDLRRGRAAYEEQVRGLIDGGADLLLLETIFDTLNAKAGIVAIENVFEENGVRLPLLISVTITDRSGRTLSGQTLDAFYTSIHHARPFSRRHQLRARRPRHASVPRGARAARRVLRAAAIRTPACRTRSASTTSSPTRPGELLQVVRHRRLRQHRRRLLRHDAGSHRGDRARASKGWRRGRCRRVRGCESEVRLKPAEASPEPRTPSPEHYTQFSGLETLTIRPDSNFQMIGERTNVTGSAKFARLIKTNDYAAAVQVAAEQVRNGANLIDVNMDEGMLDSEQAMTTFLNYIATEPEIARVPVMIDSSKWSVIEAGLKCVQGKSVVNSISLKEGEADFLHKAKIVQRFGAGVVVMAFDEIGQADTIERKVVDLPARLQAPDGAGRLRSDRHHLRSQHPGDCHRARGAQRLRHQLHRGDADHQGDLSRA